MGGGSTGSSSNSAPLSGEEQAKKFDWLKYGLQTSLPGSINSTVNPNYTPTNGEPQYTRSLNTPSYGGYSITDPGAAKSYVDPGKAQTLTGGDYEKLQADTLKGSTAGLDYLMSKERERTDADLNKRGVYNSGIGTKAQADVTDQFLPQYTQAGANATQQRYGLQADELGRVNQFNLGKASDANTYGSNQNQFALSRAQLLNTANTDLASKKYDAAYRPYDYLMGGWNGSGGTVSSGGSSGWNFSI